MNLDKDETASSIQFDNLYDTVNKIYNTKKPISRILYIAEIKEVLAKEENKPDREATFTNVREEIRKLLKKSEETFNLMIVFIGTSYSIVAIENSNENLMNYLSLLHEEMENKTSCHVTVNIITFIEECPISVFPIWYKYEGGLYQKESQVYKDKPVIEKGWVLYENFFCNLGKTIKPLIQTESDLIKNEARIKKEEGTFTKYLPSMEEIREFTGPDFISLPYFIKMYMEMIDIELDEDIIWPYQWPFNV